MSMLLTHKIFIIFLQLHLFNCLPQGELFFLHKYSYFALSSIPEREREKSSFPGWKHATKIAEMLIGKSRTLENESWVGKSHWAGFWVSQTLICLEQSRRLLLALTLDWRAKHTLKPQHLNDHSVSFWRSKKFPAGQPNSFLFFSQCFMITNTHTTLVVSSQTYSIE